MKMRKQALYKNNIPGCHIGVFNEFHNTLSSSLDSLGLDVSDFTVRDSGVGMVKNMSLHIFNKDKLYELLNGKGSEINRWFGQIGNVFVNELGNNSLEIQIQSRY